MSGNGTPPAGSDLKATAEFPAEGGTAKLMVDPDLLTPRDLRRARVALDGRNPFELLDDPLDRVVLTIWCLVSRDDPSFTWDQAEDMPFSRLETGGGDTEPDPPTAPPGSRGRGRAPSGTSGLRRKPRGDAPAPS